MLRKMGIFIVMLGVASASLVLWRCSPDQSYAETGQLAPILDGMGKLQHPVSTSNPRAQRFFNQGLVLAYGFNHAEAERSFREAARLDPDLAMAWWGVALVLGPNINAAMEDDAVPKAWQALQKAKALAGNAPQNERDYIAALGKRYAPTPVEDRSGLDKAYADAMVKLAGKYPDDANAQVLAAEALMDLHPWDYWRKDGQPQPWTPEITSRLEQAIKKWPRHPGANHFYIHAVEASKTPERAMAAADILGELAPGAGHLVHMPAHIYIRTGRYHDGSVANEKAINSDQAYITQCRNQGLYPLAYHPHNWHFLWMTASIEGDSKRALEAARTLKNRVHVEMLREAGYGTLQHFYAIPYYAMTKFGMWDKILDEAAPPTDLTYPTGVWRFARGMAHARSGQPDAAKVELSVLTQIAADSSLLAVTIWDINPTLHLMQIAREVLAGEIAAAEGDLQTAVKHVKRAIEVEDALNYDEPQPWYSPVRQTLGAMLLEAGKYAQAEKAYRQDLERLPENGWSLRGLQQALLAQGKHAEAEACKQRFDKAWTWADVDLPGSRF